MNHKSKPGVLAANLKCDPVAILDPLDIQHTVEIDGRDSEKTSFNVGLNADHEHSSKCPTIKQVQLSCNSVILKYSADDRAIQYYTGFQNYTRFTFFFGILGPAANNLTYKCRALTPQDQLFLTLMKLRQGKEDFELARIFDVSESTVGRVFSVWLNFMFYQLSEIDIWPERELVSLYMPRDFKRKFPKTRVILDATEIPIEKPSNLNFQSATFSSYKNKNTMKTVVGICPSGLVSYISETYGGRTTDRQIIERSSLLSDRQKFDSGDSFMADRGMMVQDLFATRNVEVNTPHLVGDRSQLPTRELITDRRIASKRIHVERSIGLAKTYKILKQELHHSKAYLARRIVTVCFLISNFRERIIDDYA